jgi:DNA-binding transcriptional ArsR family regulator
MRSSQSRSTTKKTTKAKAANVTPIAFSADMAALQGNALRACNLLKAMANPARLMVLCQIAHGEKSVGELERAVGLSQSGLSQHLAVLRGRKLVTTRRDAQTIYYSLASAEAATVMATLHDMYCRKSGTQPAVRLRAKAA